VPTPRILITEDEPHLRQVLKLQLENGGFDVIEARDGLEALEIARRELPDLILLDVMMPQMDGWEMLRRVQEQHGIGSIPVVMFSGKLDERTQAQATERGAQAFVGKPFDLQALLDQTKQIVPPS